MAEPLVLPSTRLLPQDPVTAVETLASEGYTRIELNYASFERAGYDHPSYPNMLRRSLLEAARRGVEVPVVHAPWEDYFLLALGRGVEAAVAEALTLAEIADSYGVEVMVFHPFSAKRVGSGRVEWINRKFFALLSERADDEGLSIAFAVENTSREKPWSRVEVVASLVSRVSHPRLRLCVDFGHALLNSYQPGEALRAASGLEACLHVHDNHGEKDEHLVPGAGSARWLTLRGRRPAARYAVVEVDCREHIEHCLARLRVAVAATEAVLSLAR